jgi:hypothetical protein
MKNHLVFTYVAAIIFVLFSGFEVNAQSVTRLIVSVPFEFYVGNEKLPEGKYEFEPANRQAFPGSLVIRRNDRSAVQSTMVPAFASFGSAEATPTITFNRYGSVHYLAGVNSGSGGFALRLAKSSREKQLAKESDRVVPVAIRTSIAATTR